MKDFARNFEKFANGFEARVVSEIQQNKNLFVSYITEQLYSGVDGNENYLRPTYLDDPWFNTEEAGRWYKKPRWYMAWKAHITPPAVSFTGIAARPRDVPNLIISGTFYDSIQAVDVSGGINITTQGVDFGADIVRKYGEDIFKVGDHGRQDWLIMNLEPSIESFWTECGL